MEIKSIDMLYAIGIFDDLPVILSKLRRIHLTLPCPGHIKTVYSAI